MRFYTLIFYLVAVSSHALTPIERQKQLLHDREVLFNDRSFPPERGLINFGVGAYNTSRQEGRPDWQIEYLSLHTFLEGRLTAGGLCTTQGSAFFYGGITWEIFCGMTHWVILPAFAPGIYIKGGGIDLGFPVEFRSSIGLGYAFQKGQRLSFHYYHISNCHLGIHNPGVEGFTLSFSLPISAPPRQRSS